VIDHTATARIERLVRWLERFKSCFGHRAQLMALRTYVQGVFSDSERKSMQAMLARVTEPVAYQAFQHFITRRGMPTAAGAAFEWCCRNDTASSSSTAPAFRNKGPRRWASRLNTVAR